VGGEETVIESLQNQWATALRDNRHHERLSTKNQLYGWRPYLVFHFQGDEEKARPLLAEVAAAIRTDGKAADESVAGTHARQSVINTVSNVYVLAGLAPGDSLQTSMEIFDKSKGMEEFFSGANFRNMVGVHR